MIDPRVAGKILKEHFEQVTPEEFEEWYDKYVLKRRGAHPLTTDAPKAVSLPASSEQGKS